MIRRICYSLLKKTLLYLEKTVSYVHGENHLSSKSRAYFTLGGILWRKRSIMSKRMRRKFRRGILAEYFSGGKVETISTFPW